MNWSKTSQQNRLLSHGPQWLSLVKKSEEPVNLRVIDTCLLRTESAMLPGF